ncbi:MAG: ssl1498 family light-harvesting-like protein [Cyanobacteria bacterium]|nr:ssl1498 family light-harvesting-like protein [Cyanobacteriota bacterium]MEB3268708.1 ssl1498 family light-harvesting-like protein [Leptolyngbya sp.]
MRYTVEEGGRLNNFAVEPKMYEAEPPTANQKRNYLVMGVAAIVLIVGLCTVAFVVS